MNIIYCAVIPDLIPILPIGVLPTCPPDLLFKCDGFRIVSQHPLWNAIPTIDNSISLKKEVNRFLLIEKRQISKKHPLRARQILRMIKNKHS